MTFHSLSFTDITHAKEVRVSSSAFFVFLFFDNFFLMSGSLAKMAKAIRTAFLAYFFTAIPQISQVAGL